MLTCIGHTRKLRRFLLLENWRNYLPDAKGAVYVHIDLSTCIWDTRLCLIPETYELRVVLFFLDMLISISFGMAYHSILFNKILCYQWNILNNLENVYLKWIYIIVLLIYLLNWLFNGRLLHRCLSSTFFADLLFSLLLFSSSCVHYCAADLFT